ncbi:hypothetical protein [Streptomyces spiralis]|uniref:hypothetical protein n=1 Tax=Streptomyces spiralis TaxID=66376 RepID=UPI0036A608A1
MPDPRDRRNRRYPLVATATAAVVGVPAATRSLTVVAERITYAPRWVRIALGFAINPFTKTVTVPHPTNIAAACSYTARDPQRQTHAANDSARPIHERGQVVET